MSAVDPKKLVFGAVFFTGLFWLPILLGNALMKDEKTR
jgi:hypothetical protein